MMDTCRGCMLADKNTQLRSLFDSGDQESCAFKQLYSLITSLKISQSDGLPTRLCTECWQQFTNLRIFRDRCIASDRIYRAQQYIAEESAATAFRYDDDTDDLDKFVSNHPEDSDCTNNDADSSKDDNKPPIIRKASSRSRPTKRCRRRSTQNSHATCSATSATRSHSKAATSVASKSFQCDLCPQTFYKKIHIEGHLRKHRGLAPYACNDCEASFALLRTLRSHRVRSHSDSQVPQFACDRPDCIKSYATSQMLRDHVRRVHLGHRPAKRAGCVCETCGLSYPFASKLAEHMYSHQDPATWPHVCDLCEKRCMTKGALQAHRMRIHLNIRNFPCTLCEKRWFTNAELLHHMASHNEEPTEQCQHCAKKYTSKVGLMLHMKRMHVGRKPYACELCDGRFIQGWLLKRHMRQMHSTKTDAEKTLAQQKGLVARILN